MIKGITFKRPYTDLWYGIIGLLFFSLWLGILVYAFLVGDWDALAPAKEGLMKDFFTLFNSKNMLAAILQSFAICLILNTICVVVLRNNANAITYTCLFLVTTCLVLIGILPMLLLPCEATGYLFYLMIFMVFSVLGNICQHWARIEIGVFMVEIVGDFFVKNMRIVLVSFVYIIIHIIAWFATIMAGVLLSHEKHSSGAVFSLYCILAWPVYMWFSMLIHNIVCYTTSTGGVFYYYNHGSARLLQG